MFTGLLHISELHLAFVEFDTIGMIPVARDIDLTAVDLDAHGMNTTFVKTTKAIEGMGGRIIHPYMTTGKTITLTRRTFVGKVMSLLLNMLSRLVINSFQGVSVF